MPDPIDPDATAICTNGTPGGVRRFGPPAAAGEAGTLGPYRLVRELGRGGMGSVYAALDTRLKRRVALKVMLPAHAADAVSKERFLREAQAAAGIKHDHVVTVYEADERDGVPYIAMEFLKGLPLDAYLKKRGTPDIPQVVRIAAEAAAGLSAAHELGLAHRDVKPANLWLEAPHGRVKVLDFGLAQTVGAGAELTRSGEVVGTPAYMSPEQARGERVDHRTDLFSLGAVLYRLCTGKAPFAGASTMAVLMALGMDEPTPVRELNPDVPEPLCDLVQWLLAKNPGQRPPSAADVADRLRQLAEDGLAPRREEPSTSRPWMVHAATSVAVAPEDSPFADLDAPDAGRPASGSPAHLNAAAVRPGAERKKGVRGVLLASAVAVLLAGCVAAAVVPRPARRGEPAEAAPAVARSSSPVTGPGRAPDAPASLKPGDLVMLESLGFNADQDKYRYFDGRTTTGAVALSQYAGGAYSGTRWRVSDMGSGLVGLECQGHADGPRWLDGGAGTGEVRLVIQGDGSLPGTKWKAVESKEGVQLECRGAADGTRWLYGVTAEGRVQLTKDATYSGTRWRVRVVDQAEKRPAPAGLRGN